MKAPWHGKPTPSCQQRAGLGQEGQTRTVTFLPGRQRKGSSSALPSSPQDEQIHSPELKVTILSQIRSSFPYLLPTSLSLVLFSQEAWLLEFCSCLLLLLVMSPNCIIISLSSHAPDFLVHCVLIRRQLLAVHCFIQYKPDRLCCNEQSKTSSYLSPATCFPVPCTAPHTCVDECLDWSRQAFTLKPQTQISCSWQLQASC